MVPGKRVHDSVGILQIVAIIICGKRILQDEPFGNFRGVIPNAIAVKKTVIIIGLSGRSTEMSLGRYEPGIAAFHPNA